MTSPGKGPFDTGPGSGLDPAVRAFRAVLLAAQRLRHRMDERLRPDGLTTQQAALLTAMAGLGRPSVTEAAAALGTSHQNVAQLVAALRRKDMVRVEADPADGRRRCLVATSTSARYWSERDDADVAAVAGWFGVLSDEEIGTLCALLIRVVDGLERER